MDNSHRRHPRRWTPSFPRARTRPPTREPIVPSGFGAAAILALHVYRLSSKEQSCDRERFLIYRSAMTSGCGMR
jgi:hypothetical protein